MSIAKLPSAPASRAAHWRYGAAWFITFVVGGVAVLFLASLAYLLVQVLIALPSTLQTYPAYRRGELGLLDAAVFGLGLHLMVWLPVSLYVALYVLPFILTLPASAPIIALWHSPPRALMLRPFNRGRLSLPLRRIVRRDLARYAHVYTLSDADIKVPWYVRVPVVFGQLALFSFRMRMIRDARRIGALERAMRRTWLRNINWCMAVGKTFPVATSDSHWREVVDCLLKQASIVIIDVSELRENVAWEIERARSLGAENRIIYLCSLQSVDRSRDALRRTLGPGASSRIFGYQQDGTIERDRFHAAIVESMAIEPTHPGQSVLAVAAAFAFASGLVPVLALAFPALAENIWLPRWNPWKDPGSWPGLSAVINTQALSVALFGVATWVLLFVAARRAPNLWFLLVIQTLVLLAAPVGMLDW